jgi:hypothetical protein
MGATLCQEVVMESKKATLARLARFCRFSQPNSGCILSGLKTADLAETLANIDRLSEAMIDRILTFHEECPYRERAPI